MGTMQQKSDYLTVAIVPIWKDQLDKLKKAPELRAFFTTYLSNPL